MHATEHNTSEHGLYLSPNLCLLSEKETSCQIDIKLRWGTPTAGHYCIHKSPQQTPLECWPEDQQGQLKVSFNLNENLTLYLVNANTDQVIYQQTVRLQKQVKRTRRARRNPWRFY